MCERQSGANNRVLRGKHSQKEFQLQKFYKLKAELEKDNCIIGHRLFNGRREVVGIEITEKGYEKYGLKRNFISWRGSYYPHSFFAESIRRHFQKQGKTVVREKKLGDHWADLWVQQEKLAVEVAVGNKPEMEVQNIERDLQHAENVLVIGNDKDHLQKIMKHFPVAGKVQFKLFCDVVK